MTTQKIGQSDAEPSLSDQMYGFHGAGFNSQFDPEPVAWLFTSSDGKRIGATKDKVVAEHSHKGGVTVEPLYTAQPRPDVSATQSNAQSNAEPTTFHEMEKKLLPGLRRAAYILQQYWEPDAIVPAFDAIQNEIKRIEALAQSNAEPMVDRDALISELRATANEIVDWHGLTMNNWDRWRAAIAEGEMGSWPRDSFESLMDCHADLMERAALALTQSAPPLPTGAGND